MWVWRGERPRIGGWRTEFLACKNYRTQENGVQALTREIGIKKTDNKIANNMQPVDPGDYQWQRFEAVFSEVRYGHQSNSTECYKHKM